MSKRKRPIPFNRRKPLPPPFPEDFWSEDEPIVTFARSYQTIGTTKPVQIADALERFALPDTDILHAKHAGAAVLGESLKIIVPLIDTRHKQHKRALGGNAHPLRFDAAELEPVLPDPNRMPTKFRYLSQNLHDDLWVLLRLVREARSLYKRHSQVWLLFHKAIGRILVRLLLAWKQLRRLHGYWLALVALRWALHAIWGVLFGTPVHLTKAQNGG